MASLGRASAIIGAGTLFSRVTGLVRSVVLVAVIGSFGSNAADAFSVAAMLPTNVYELLAAGVITSILVPQIVKAAAHTDGGARYVSKLLTLGAVVLVAATALMMALAPVLNACGSPLRGLSVIGWACIAMAVLLAAAERLARHRRGAESITFIDAMLVGIAQVGALIPGVSRSGSTLTAALALGFRREEAARFSFLLGVPAVTLAGLKEIWELHKAHLDAHGWSVLAVGLVVASVSAFAAIWGLMRILERYSAWPFVIYRALLGLFLLTGVGTGWLR